MPARISAGVGDHLCFLTFYNYDTVKFLILTVPADHKYYLCYICWNCAMQILDQPLVTRLISSDIMHAEYF